MFSDVIRNIQNETVTQMYHFELKETQRRKTHKAGQRILGLFSRNIISEGSNVRSIDYLV